MSSTTTLKPGLPWKACSTGPVLPPEPPTKLRAWQERGGEIQYAFYPGKPHAFTYEDDPVARRCMADLTSFILSELRR